MIRVSSFRILPPVTNVTIANLPLSLCRHISKLTVWALRMLTALSTSRLEKNLFRQSSELARVQRVQRFGLTGKLLVFFIGILLLGMVGFQFFRQYVITPPMMTPSQTIPTAIPPSATIILPTNSPAPTSTFVPTTTIVPQVHALEVPINVGDHKFLIHRVGAGETFEILAKTYTTTPEVIRSLNYSMKPSLWANSVIVISPGLQTVDLALPAFKTYQVTAQAITIDELAGKLTIDPVLLRLYNACNDNCRLSAGDWLILPISK